MRTGVTGTYSHRSGRHAESLKPSTRSPQHVRTNVCVSSRNTSFISRLGGCTTSTDPARAVDKTAETPSQCAVCVCCTHVFIVPSLSARVTRREFRKRAIHSTRSILAPACLSMQEIDEFQARRQAGGRLNSEQSPR